MGPPLRTCGGGWLGGGWGWEGNLEKGVGDRSCLRMAGMGGFPGQGNSYEVGGFPMVAVFWNFGAQAVMGALGSGTPIIYLRYV